MVKASVMKAVRWVVVIVVGSGLVASTLFVGGSVPTPSPTYYPPDEASQEAAWNFNNPSQAPGVEAPAQEPGQSGPTSLPGQENSE